MPGRAAHASIICAWRQIQSGIPFPKMQRIYLVTKDGSVSSVHMPYDLAFSKLREGTIEEVYETPGHPETFKGVRLCEKPGQPRENFYRGSLDLSKSTITHEQSARNAEAVADKFYNFDRERVIAWPFEHDRRNVVISAGKVCNPCFA